MVKLNIKIENEWVKQERIDEMQMSLSKLKNDKVFWGTEIRIRVFISFPSFPARVKSC